MKTKMLILGPCLLLGGLMTGATAAQADTTPPSLAGETFRADQGPWSAALSCNPDGSGSFTLHATGTATGPYPGTFVEDTSVTSTAPSTNPETTLVSYHATFTITSPTGTVSGTKEFVPGSPGFAACQSHGRGTGGWFDAPSVTYSATIVSGASTFTDSGTATATDWLQGRPARIEPERFLTSNGVIAGCQGDGQENGDCNGNGGDSDGSCLDGDEPFDA